MPLRIEPKANAEMIEGYMDGLDLNTPEPSANRSHSYRHGFANGRDDRRGKPRDTCDALCDQAKAAMLADECACPAWSEPWPNCPTCKGRGTVNPLTPNLPEDFFCVGVTDCPTCDGTGECP